MKMLLLVLYSLHYSIETLSDYIDNNNSRKLHKNIPSKLITPLFEMSYLNIDKDFQSFSFVIYNVYILFIYFSQKIIIILIIMIIIQIIKNQYILISQDWIKKMLN